MSPFILPAALLLATANAAAAQEPVPSAEQAPLGASAGGFSIGGEVGLMSDYRFRGVSRSDEDPAAQAGLTLQHDSGFYVGARGTTLNGLDSFRLRDPSSRDLGDVQVDLYAGYTAEIGAGFELDGGAMYYLFAGGEGATDYVEPYASLSYLIGPLSATAGAKYAPAQAAIGDEDMLYLYGQVDAAIPFLPWRFSAQAGRQDWGRFGSYWNWSLGASYHVQIPLLPSAEIGLRYVDTDLPSLAGQDRALVLGLTVGF
jgi:uncharacterized protein (TIGR02001 family)